MNKILFAEIISFIFNPLIILIPMPFFLVFETTGNLFYSFQWTALTLIFMFLFLIFVLFGIKKGFFSDLDVSKRKQRTPLFLSGIILTLIYLCVLYYLRAPTILLIGGTSIILALSVFELVNKFIKASVHIATLSAFLTFFVLVEGWIYLPSFILIPLVAWSRIKTKNHSPREVAVGFSLGVLLTIFIFAIFKYIIHV
ncbi:MAG TPA: hypothetical protein VF385_00105 [Patescibacteria group bacterium]